MFESRISVGAKENYRGGKNLTQTRMRGPTTWRDMLKNEKVEQLYKVSSPCLDDHEFEHEEHESVGELPQVLLTNCTKMLKSATNW